jgi:hypothetical protein
VWTYGRAPILPRYPGNITSLLPYILPSERLKEDCKGVADLIDKKMQIDILKEKCRRYGLVILVTRIHLVLIILVWREIKTMDQKEKSMFDLGKGKIACNMSQK